MDVVDTVDHGTSHLSPLHPFSISPVIFLFSRLRFFDCPLQFFGSVRFWHRVGYKTFLIEESLFFSFAFPLGHVRSRSLSPVAFFTYGANKSIGIGKNVVVLCSLEISFIVCRNRSWRAIG